MPTERETAPHYRTVVITDGTGRRRILRVAIVRKRGPRGGHPATAPTNTTEG